MSEAHQKTVQYCCSLFPPKGEAVPEEFSNAIIQLEKELGMPIWLLIQNETGQEPIDIIGNEVWNLFVDNEKELPQDKVGLIINSAGGFAQYGYQIARLFKRRCKGFVAIIPRYAKSAATLLTLGANKILMGRHAELGPLDAQIEDPERERTVSALDEIQSLERLRAFALESIDETMLLIVQRSGKMVATMLPQALHFIAEMMRPLLEKVDIVDYTQMSRVLKVAEEYAIRLLTENIPPDDARIIARHLVEHYPEHGFFISVDEAKGMGLPIEQASDKIDEILDSLYHYIVHNNPTILGHLVIKE